MVRKEDCFSWVFIATAGLWVGGWAGVHLCCTGRDVFLRSTIRWLKLSSLGVAHGYKCSCKQEEAVEVYLSMSS